MLPRAILLISLLTLGCAWGGGKETVTIDDNFSGFRITSVDGKPPQRDSHPVHTVQPMPRLCMYIWQANEPERIAKCVFPIRTKPMSL